MMCSPLVSRVQSVFQEDPAGILWDPAPKASDFFWSEGSFGSAGTSPAFLTALPPLASRPMGTGFAPGSGPLKGKEPSRLFPWAGASPWSPLEGQGSGGSGGGDNPPCQEDLSAFGNLQDYPTSLAGWIDTAQNDGEAPVITGVTPPSGSQVDAANLTINAHISDASAVAIQVWIDNFLVIYQGSERFDPATGNFTLSTPLTYVVCRSPTAPPSNEKAFVPIGQARRVKIVAIDKGGNKTTAEVIYSVANSEIPGMKAEIDSMRTAVQEDAALTLTEKEVLLKDADLLEAMLDAPLDQTPDPFLTRVQAYINALEQWDGTIDGLQIVSPEQKQEFINRLRDLMGLLGSPLGRQYWLGIGGAVMGIIGVIGGVVGAIGAAIGCHWCECVGAVMFLASCWYFSYAAYFTGDVVEAVLWTVVGAHGLCAAVPVLLCA